MPTPDYQSIFGQTPQSPAAPANQGGQPDYQSIFGGAKKPKGGEQAAPADEQEMPPPKLPEGAEGWDPSGNPYFGEGIKGIVKKWQYNFTKDVKDVDEADWTDIKARWSAMANAKPEGGLSTSLEKTAEQNEGNISLLGETIGKSYQDIVASSQGSVLAPVLKGVGASVTALGELFSIPAQWTEQGLGALQGFQEGVNELDSPLPRLDQNAFTRAIEDTPLGLGLAYDFARIALSPTKGKWDTVKTKTEEGWESGRILYSQLFDETLKEKFLEEYREGGDPALIAMKLQNPLAELGGQLILDPLNLVGVFGKASKIAKELDRAHDSVVASGLLKTEEGKAAFKAIAEATDDAGAIKALDTLTLAQQKAVENVQGTSKLLSNRFGITDLTASSRQNAIIGKGKELLGNMALILKQSGMNNDGVAEAIVYGIKSVSKNADEMKAGLSGLSHMPNSNMWLSDDYIETFTMMNRLMGDEGKGIAALAKIRNPAEFAEAAKKMMQAAAFSELPDVNELQKAADFVKQAAKTGGELTEKTKEMAEAYKNLPNHVKQLNKISNQIDKVRNPINNVLSRFYFNWQGGVAVKNVIGNNELILLDKGAGAWLKDGKYWSTGKVVDYLKDIYEVLPESASGFKSLVASATGKEDAISLAQLSDAKGLGEKAKLLAEGFKKQQFGILMSLGEEGGAARVVGSSVRDTFSKMIPKALPSLAADVQKGVLSQKQADKLSSLVLKNNGNMERALNEFREFYKLGAVEEWRNLDFVQGYQKEALQSLDYWDDIEQLAQGGAATVDEVEAVFAKINKSIDSRSELATKDVVGLSEDHAGAPVWGDLMKAVEDGHLDPGQQQVFTAIMEGAEQARLDYQTLLDDIALKAQDALNTAGKLPEARRIGTEMNRVREALRKAGPATAKEAHQITQDAWRWSDSIKAEKKPTPEVLAAYWTKAGLDGAPPLDLNKQTLLKTLWEQRFKKVSDTWNSSFDAIVGESETILKQMEGVVDATELQSMASRTRHITKQAQAIRSAKFDGKTLRIEQTKTVLDIAKDFGIPTAAKSGKPNDVKLLNIINKYGGLETKVPDTIRQAVTITDEIGDNPLTLLKQKGGVNAAEFPDVTGGKLGKDKEGVIPGLFQKKGMGIDEAGRMLSDYGYITPEQAEDANFVRDFIRNPKKSAQTFTEEFTDTTAPFFDEKGRLQNAPPDWKFTSMDEVPIDVAKKAFANQRQAHGLPPLEVPNQGIAIPPPHPLGSQPSLPRAWNESSRGAKHVLDSIKNEILNRWGKTDDARQMSPEIDAVLSRVAADAGPKIQEIKAIALKVATEQRNFTLLNYGAKTYGDVALSYVMPYHFFYTRSYKNWISRIATNPEILAGYGKYKNALEDINKDLPDWYKQQVNVTELLGIKTDHPLYMNLEATFNPLYGLTGTDFQDPAKRVNWATATFDDFSKFGPTTWAPIQMAIAAKLYMDGEIDAASRWGTRLIPETAQIKAVSSMFGQPIELDPAVQMFSGKGLLDTTAMDPYESGRMSYSAAELIQTGQFTAEEVQEQFQQQQGPAWDKARRMAIQVRAGSSITSYIGGVGFKPRSQSDVIAEEMFTSLNKIYAMSDTMTPEQYKNEWEKLRSSYPDGMVDTALLAKKGGDKRDAAYAFSVLGRLPPGQMSDVFKVLGISQEDVSRFYESKGFTSPDIKFTETEKERFMAAVVDMGAMLKIPESATRQEWNEVRTMYSDAQEMISEELGFPYDKNGKGVWDVVNHYYDLKDDNPDAAEAFKAQHPEVSTALQMMTDAKATDPLLSAYYGGIDTIQMYVSGKVRAQLEAKYGEDIQDKQTMYFDLKIQSPGDAKAFLRQHPELIKYWGEKKELDKQANQQYIEMGLRLPEAQGAEIREGFEAQSGVQESLLETLQAPLTPQVSWEQMSGWMSPAMTTIMTNHLATGAALSPAALKQVDYISNQQGFYNAAEFLREAGLAYAMQTQQGGGGGTGTPNYQEIFAQP